MVRETCEVKRWMNETINEKGRLTGPRNRAVIQNKKCSFQTIRSFFWLFEQVVNIVRSGGGVAHGDEYWGWWDGTKHPQDKQSTLSSTHHNHTTNNIRKNKQHDESSKKIPEWAAAYKQPYWQQTIKDTSVQLTLCPCRLSSVHPLPHSQGSQLSHDSSRCQPSAKDEHLIVSSIPRQLVITHWRRAVQEIRQRKGKRGCGTNLSNIVSL